MDSNVGAQVHEPRLPEDVLHLIERRVADGRYPSVVVGLVDERGPRVYGFGAWMPADAEEPRAPDAHTVYEIASLTKVFTGVLLATMAVSGDVRLDAPVAELLPAGVRVPEYRGRPITLSSLSTHTSGLPHHPANLPNLQKPVNPYAGYTPELLYEALGQIELSHAPGDQPEYSNLGVGLLGFALAQHAGVDFGTLLQRRLLAPMGLADTAITPSADMQRHLAVGTESGRRVPPGDLSILNAMGGLRSTAHDLLMFLAATMGMRETTLRAALEMSRAVQVRSADGQPLGGLGWGIQSEPRPGLLTHSGNNDGYASFMGARLSNELGVVVLTNAGGDVQVDDIGRRLLDEASKLPDVAILVDESEMNAARTRSPIVDVFSQDVAGAWAHSEGIAEDKFDVADRKVCVGLTATRGQDFWWPKLPEITLQLEEGAPYSVFFRAAAEGPLRVRLKVSVGHRVTPHPPFVQAEAGTIGAGKWYRVDFVPRQTVQNAGIFFDISSNPASGESRFCLSDLLVVRQENAAPETGRDGSKNDSVDPE